jgi:hypothetical protein
MVKFYPVMSGEVLSSEVFIDLKDIDRAIRKKHT